MSNPADIFKLRGGIRRNRIILILFVGFTAFHVAISLCFGAPVSVPDEISVLSISSHFAGWPVWREAYTAYFGYAHSLLYTPLFWIFKDINHIYIGALCINGLIVSLIPVFCYKFLLVFGKLENTTILIAISIVVGLYPYLSLYTKFTRNETLLTLFVFLCGWLLVRSSQSIPKYRRWVYSALLGIVPVLAYAAHGIGLVFIIAVCLVLPIGHLLLRRPMVNYLIFLISLVLFFLLDAQIKTYLQQTVFSLAEGIEKNTFSFSFNRMMQNVFSLQGLHALVLAIGGRLHYISSASLGLFPIGIVATIAFAWQWFKSRRNTRRLSKTEKNHMQEKDSRSGNTPVLIALVFWALLLTGGMLVSTVNHVGTIINHQGTYFFYGRYYEYMCLPFILFGLYFFFDNKLDKKRLICLLASALAIYLLLWGFCEVFIGDKASAGVMKRASVFGVLPFLGNSFHDLWAFGNYYNAFDRYNFATLSVFVLIVFLTISLLMLYRKRLLILAGLASCFVYITVFCLASTVIPWSNYRLQSHQPFITAQNILTELHMPTNSSIDIVYLGDEDTFKGQMRLAQLSMGNYAPLAPYSFEDADNLTSEIVICLSSFALDESNPAYTVLYNDKKVWIWQCTATNASL